MNNITDKQRANLLKLAEYLESGQIKGTFDMHWFCEYNELEEGVCVQEEDMLDCGSVGCAIGHGPFAGIPKFVGEDWNRYSDRVFGMQILPGCSTPDEWQWCFDGSWQFSDNTPEGAAKRIRWVLEKGLPEDWSEQMAGDAPFCYK